MKGNFESQVEHTQGPSQREGEGEMTYAALPPTEQAEGNVRPPQEARKELERNREVVLRNLGKIYAYTGTAPSSEWLLEKIDYIRSAEALRTLNLALIATYSEFQKTKDNSALTEKLRRVLKNAEYEAQDEGLRNLDEYLTSLGTKLNETPPLLPVDNEGRIEMREYGEIFSPSEMRRDAGAVQSVQATLDIKTETGIRAGHGKKRPRAHQAERLREEIQKGQRISDAFEKLTVALLHKAFFLKGLTTVRSSSFDDVRHKVDSFIVDRQTGEVICALDETTAEEGTPARRGKDAAAEKMNEQGGTSVKYGVNGIAGDNFSLAEVPNVPLFVLQLPRTRIDRVLRYFENSPELSREELAAAEELMNLASYRAMAIAHSDRYPEPVRQRARKFQQALERLETTKINEPADSRHKTLA